MDINASDIYSFYQTKLGGIVKRIIRQKIMSYLDEVDTNIICGYGYTSPYLSFINKHNASSQVNKLKIL